MIYQPQSGMAPVTRQASQQMINRPVVVPASESGGAMAVLPADPYFSIEVDTTALSETTEIILFDANTGFQYGYNKAMHVDVVVRGNTASYETIVNDVAHNASYFDTMQMGVSVLSGDANSIAMSQFANPIDVYEATKGSRPKHIDTIYPAKGINESQYHLYINTFTHPVMVTNRTALVYKQRPGIILTFKFYQRAELGGVR